MKGSPTCEIDDPSISVNFRYQRKFDKAPMTFQLGSGYEETKKGTHSVLYMVWSCSCLRSDEPFNFRETDIVEILKAEGFIC